MRILEIDNRIHVANDADAWERRGRISRLYYEPEINPGLALVGASGSGKTYQALLCLAKLGLSVKYDRITGIRTGPRAIISDFKGDRSLRFLIDGNTNFQRPDGMTTHYGSYQNAVSILECFDNEFRSRLASSDDDSPLHLYIDELPSLLSAMPKSERSKVDSNIYQYLAMNRNLGLSLILACQRFDSAWFTAGARENICSRSGLGTLSKDSARMLFPEIDNIEPQGKGRGYYLSGNDLKRIIVPNISNIQKLQQNILKAITW